MSRSAASGSSTASLSDRQQMYSPITGSPLRLARARSGHKRTACQTCNEEYMVSGDGSSSNEEEDDYLIAENFRCADCSRSVAMIGGNVPCVHVLYEHNHMPTKKVSPLRDPSSSSSSSSSSSGLTNTTNDRLAELLPFEIRKMVGPFLPITDHLFMDALFHFMLKHNDRKTHRHYCLERRNNGEPDLRHNQVLPALHKLVADGSGDSSSIIHLFFGRVFYKWTFYRNSMKALSRDSWFYAPQVSCFDDNRVLLIFARVFQWGATRIDFTNVGTIDMHDLLMTTSVRETVQEISHSDYTTVVANIDMQMFLCCTRLRDLKLSSTLVVTDTFLKKLACSCPDLSRLRIVMDKGLFAFQTVMENLPPPPPPPGHTAQGQGQGQQQGQQLQEKLSAVISFTVKGLLDFFQLARSLTTYEFQIYLECRLTISDNVGHNNCMISRRLFWGLDRDTDEVRRRLKKCLVASTGGGVARAIDTFKVSIYTSNTSVRNDHYNLVDDEILSLLLKFDSIRSLELHHGGGVECGEPDTEAGLELLLRLICEKVVEVLVLVDFKHVSGSFLKRIRSPTLKLVVILNSDIFFTKDEFGCDNADDKKSVIETIRENLPQLERLDFSMMHHHVVTGVLPPAAAYHISNLTYDPVYSNLLFDEIAHGEFNASFCKKSGFCLSRFHDRFLFDNETPLKPIYNQMKVHEWAYYSLTPAGEDDFEEDSEDSEHSGGNDNADEDDNQDDDDEEDDDDEDEDEDEEDEDEDEDDN